MAVFILIITFFLFITFQVFILPEILYLFLLLPSIYSYYFHYYKPSGVGFPFMIIKFIFQNKLI